MQHEELEKKLLDQMVEHLHAKEKEFREEIEKKVRVIAIVLWFEITELIVEQQCAVLCVHCILQWAQYLKVTIFVGINVWFFLRIGPKTQILYH